MPTGFETNMKFIICVIWYFTWSFSYTKLWSLTHPPAETTMSPLLLLLRMVRGFPGRLIKSSYVFSGFRLFKMLKGGRKKKSWWICSFGFFHILAKFWRKKCSYLYTETISLKSLFSTILNIDGAEKMVSLEGRLYSILWLNSIWYNSLAICGSHTQQK